MRSFFVQNFGCRASQADGAAIEASLGERGLVPASQAKDASLVVLNTCTVTASADQDVRSLIRKLQREQPESKILVTGCYAQREPEALASISGVTWVVGNSHKGSIASLVTDEPIPYHAHILTGDLAAQEPFFAAPADRARPNLKIQDGCNNRCSFCIIPGVRGRSRSAEANWVVEQVAKFALAGYPEVVLTGINLGRWGREFGNGRLFPSLLRRLLTETGIESLRLSSVEPMDFSDELLELMAGNPRIAQHVHAPLQSGSDTVLRRMYRKYRPRHYEDRVRRARALMPNAAIGADVMTGFPGETEAEFRDSAAFIEAMPFTYLHVFSYSERPGTKASEAAAPVPMELRRDRNRILQEIGERKNLEFRRSQIGRRERAVALQSGQVALTSNYLRVDLAEGRPPRACFEVELGAIGARGMRESSPLLILT